MFSKYFAGKTVLITGANGGIGRELVCGFADIGAKVIAHVKSTEEKKTDADIFAKQSNISLVTADFSKPAEIDLMISQIIDTYSSLDVLINNAGIEIRKPYEEFSMEEYDLISNVNIRSVFQLTKGLFGLLKEAANNTTSEGSTVINISSIHQSLAYPSNTPYNMSKAAMDMFSKTVGTEWAPYNIRVNNLAPGAIMTQMNKNLIEDIGIGTFSSWIGSGKIGTGNDVLQACFFLASPMSRYMTAQTLYLDGALSTGLLPYGKTPAIQKMTQELLAKDKNNKRDTK